MIPKAKFFKQGLHTTLDIELPATTHVDLNKWSTGALAIVIFDPPRELLEALKAAVEKALE